MEGGELTDGYGEIQDNRWGFRLIPGRSYKSQFQVLPAVQVERGNLSSAGTSVRVRGNQSARSQASDASQSCWSAAGGWSASDYLLMVSTDGGQ